MNNLLFWMLLKKRRAEPEPVPTSENIQILVDDINVVFTSIQKSYGKSSEENISVNITDIGINFSLVGD